ncbi:MAG: hypothetical protein ACREDA_02370, partial [Methylocella sp.]
MAVSSNYVRVAAGVAVQRRSKANILLASSRRKAPDQKPGLCRFSLYAKRGSTPFFVFAQSQKKLAFASFITPTSGAIFYGSTGSGPKGQYQSRCIRRSSMNKSVSPKDGSTAVSVNVFRVLFDFRPGEDTTPKENFLTEALVYALSSSKPAADAWVKFITEERVRPDTVNIATRKSHRDEDTDTMIFPDIRVEGLNQGGRPYLVIVEHKWDSNYNEEQLRRYSALRGCGRTSHLAFICAKTIDRKKADEFQAPRFCGRTWEEVYRCLEKVKTKSQILREFLEFMEAVGLSPDQPITVYDLKAAALKNITIDDWRNALRSKMRRYCEKLSNEYPWEDIPLRFRDNREVVDKYGRCAVMFSDKDDWRPGIGFGFYYSTHDHKVPFVDPQKGIDLVIRVQASPWTNRSPQRVLE